MEENGFKWETFIYLFFYLKDITYEMRNEHKEKEQK